MKKIWDEIKKNYGKNRTEILLMCLFVGAAVVLNGPQIAREALSGNIAEDPKESGTSEEESGVQTETADFAESKETSESENLSGSDDKFGADSREETGGSMETSARDEEESGQAEGDSRVQDQKSGIRLDDSDLSGEKSPEAEGTFTESEETSEEAAKASAESGETTQEASGISGGTSEASEALVEVQADPEYEIETILTESGQALSLEYRDLRDWKKLHGFELRTPEEAALTASLPDDWNWKILWGEQEEKPISLLEKMLENRLAGYDGDWSVYVKNLSTDESFIVNDRPMKSASVMKLFIMGTVYKSFENGTLERTEEIMSLVGDMITYSDNEASNQLLYLLGDSSYEAGIEKVNDFIHAYGFSDMTVEYNGFNNPATNTDSGSMNQVAAKDCGRLLEDIYRRIWVSRKVSNEMEALLLFQNTRYKIPAGLPEGVLCGNKTGEMDTTENDAAIVYSDSCDYILVVLSSDWNSKDEAIFRIQSISDMVYQFWN